MGLFEILLIAVVTLLVVGPERMPEAVRSVALTVGRVKRFVSHARAEIEKQVGADDIRQQLHNEAVLESLENAKHGLSDFDASLKSSVTEEYSIMPEPRSSVEVSSQEGAVAQEQTQDNSKA